MRCRLWVRAMPQVLTSSTASAVRGVAGLALPQAPCHYMRMHAYTDEELDAHLPVAVEIFSLLADATRVRLVLALRDGEQSVGVLAEAVCKSQAAVSQHLAKLRMSRVVSTRHEGNRVYYRLANKHALELVEVACNQAEHAVDTVVRHRDH